MKKTKRTALEEKGWRLGSAADFLQLTEAEAAFVETKLALSRSLRDRRVSQEMSQAALAKRLRGAPDGVRRRALPPAAASGHPAAAVFPLQPQSELATRRAPINTPHSRTAAGKETSHACLLRSRRRHQSDQGQTLLQRPIPDQPTVRLRD